jgi:hypothetical protein
LTNKRGKSPDKLTLMKLCAVSGGRCQFAGCNNRLFKDHLTWIEFNNSNVAHIVASSPDGPRGSENSHEQSNKLENLMLLCPSCHKRIDDNPDMYTVDVLKKMKEDQERKVQELLDTMYYPKSEIVILESPIKGKTSVHVNPGLTVEAVRSVRKNPASEYPITINLDGASTAKYSSKTYWHSLEKKLQTAVQIDIFRRLSSNPDMHFSVFPIAPIPLIAKLGEILGDKREIDIFQKTRNPNTWCWLNENETNSFDIEKYPAEKGDVNKVAIILSLTADVAIQRINENRKYGIIYYIRAKQQGVNCISSKADLRKFWMAYQQVCDSIKNVDGLSDADVFPAIPVSAAFEIGRRYMPQVYPKLHIYDEDNGFFEALTIGGKR